ncbi:MAG: replication initiator protein A [Rubrobacter sp.]|nr:replication initiator protein A [Rubrobacter sp.]
MAEKVTERREQAKGLVLAEGNFEEHPYFRVGDRNAGTGVLTYENELRTRDGHILRQSWTVRAVHGRGLPGRFDQDVYVALLQMIDDKGLPADGWLSFSLYELVELMGRKHSGRDYRQVRESLRRLATTSIESDNAFYHRGWKEYISDTFSLLSEVKLSEYEDPQGERTDRNRVLLSQYFVDSYKANYLKNIDVEFYWSLASPIAKRLYRLVDKKRNGRRRWEVELFSLKDRIPLSDYKYASKIKEKLAPAHAELIEKDFLKKITYRKNGGKEFASYAITETFHARRSAIGALEPPGGDEFFCVQRLKAEGMETKAAEELVATHGPSRVMRYVEALPYQKNLRNPAGWLRKAIENNYELDMPPISGVLKQASPGANVEATLYQHCEARRERKDDYAWFFSETEETQSNRKRFEEEEQYRAKASEDLNLDDSSSSEPILDPQAIEAWESLVEDLVALLGQDSLSPWFDQLEGGYLEGATLTVLVPNSTAANYLNDNLGADLLHLWRERVGEGAVLEVTTDLAGGKRALLTG